MNDDLYPTFTANGLKWYAHRWAYAYFIGPHRARQELDHVCGIELCVRPDHLFPVGHKENIRLRDRRLYLPDAWITPRNYRRVWTPRADEFALQHNLPAPRFGLAS
ncbi:HNH endonuclease [Sinomonas atrocyanea]|uniref:HNH endonuclease n=1 Tax=Sinomonas atrocyanea TaxID=37927 RepID=UPI0035930182